MVSQNLLASAVQLVSIASLVNTVTALPGSSRYISRQVTEDRVKGQTYDYIIAGGGLSGLVVANRLTENPRVKVLVIEYGVFDDSATASVPYFANGLNMASMIPTTSAPDAGLNNASFPVLIGGVVGGGSVVNGMAYNRGAAQDYDAWEQLGNAGWGFSSLLPYFRKSTTFQAPSAATAKEFELTYDLRAYGNGPIKPALTNFQFPDLKKFWQAWQDDETVPKPKEHGLGEAVGAFWMPSTIDVARGRRSDARSEYYDPVANRTNLQILTGTTVDEVLFQDGLTASGVSFSNRASGAVSQAFATREVILAAGAINTPKILQLSGIGPKAAVEAAGIRSKLDLPAVGSNFQDHPVAFLGFNLSNQAFPNGNSIATNASYNATAFAEYEASRTGIYASARGNGVAFLSLPQVASTEFAESIAARVSKQDAPSFLPPVYGDANLLRGFLEQRRLLSEQYGGNDAAVSEFPFSGGTGSVAASFQKPLSRGTITLNPADPKGNPVIQYNTIQNPLDAEMVLAVVRRARTYFKSPALASLKPVETLPGAQFESDADLLGALKQGVLNPSFAHPAGSCPMMPRRLGGCVDSTLKVYGTRRLSVIDTSIMPMIPAAHLQASQYAVAEKAADLIKARIL
ncbi:Long-chain-alcohol oxidase FAO3 [Sphaceloma murrayae]|uniref:Long-chain-alcohol oxidase FAO3 n=1 Tax=Sphaceloma murrayae TaxID=2082308 RepID=A0A2K1R1A9_9PEZI|nr:Long-chain-alcohol oxidase FAO3 [Sphaceloma murrayae]